MGMLHGLSQRLAIARHTKPQNARAWQGVDNGGTLRLGVSYEGKAKGEITLGFFTDPHWWKANPVQVRTLPGAGIHRIDRLPPGKYYLGAMTGPFSEPVAGVHQTWPKPVTITADGAAKARLVLSPEFNPTDHGLRRTTGPKLAGDWPEVNENRLITVRVLDHQGQPVPFARVIFLARKKDNPKNLKGYYNTSTDQNGFVYNDEFEGPFTINVQTNGFRLDPLGTGYTLLAGKTTYNTADKPVITFRTVPRPEGSSVVTGKVHDQHGRPLTEFHVDFMREESELPRYSGEIYGRRLSVISQDGTFRIDGLKPGRLRLRAFAFDYPAYVYEKFVTVDVPEEGQPPVHVDYQIEAKQQFFGRAVYKSGEAVYPGGWTARFSRNAGPFGGNSFSLNTEPGGLFRVTLSEHEMRQLNQNSEGKVDVYGQGRNAPRIQVPVKSLSTDRQKPTRIVLPAPVADSKAEP